MEVLIILDLTLAADHYNAIYSLSNNTLVGQ